MSRKDTPSINVSTDARVVVKRAFAAKVANLVSDVENWTKSAWKSRSRRRCAPMWSRPCLSFGIVKRTSVPSWLVRIAVGIIRRYVVRLLGRRIAGGVFGSVRISDLARGVLREAKAVFMLDGDRSSSSCVAKDVDRRIASARTPGPASSASIKGKSA